MKRHKILDFSCIFWKVMGWTKKYTFLFFFYYLKTETRKNSEKNYKNVSLDGRCISIFRKIFSLKLITKKKNILNKFIFWKNATFEESKKIHSNSPKSDVNFRYIIKVHTRKLREIIIVFGAFLESEGTRKPWEGRFCDSFVDFW